MTTTRNLPPGWETYSFSDEDGVKHEAAQLRRTQAKATWREAWQAECEQHELIYNEAVELLVSVGHYEAAEYLRATGKFLRDNIMQWTMSFDEDGTKP